MSILIKGMKLPTNGNETIIRIQPKGTILDQYGHHLIIKAVHIPSHGRLIDADALCKIMKKHAEKHGGFGGLMVMMAKTCIENAPTIIEAEEVTQKKEGQ